MNAKELKAGTQNGDQVGEDAHISGTIGAVNVGGLTGTIAPNGGGSSVTLKVLAGTKIEVNGDLATLADIRRNASPAATGPAICSGAMRVRRR